MNDHHPHAHLVNDALAVFDLLEVQSLALIAAGADPRHPFPTSEGAWFTPYQALLGRGAAVATLDEAVAASRHHVGAALPCPPASSGRRRARA